MTLFDRNAALRRKAVWGPKRTIAAVVAALVVGLAPSAMAAGHHSGQGSKAAAGRPNSNVQDYKVDGELTRRSSNPANTLTNHTSKVIVELQPGATLPPQFASYARRNGKLGIINGQVLELPDRLITQMARHPSVFRLHYDRPSAKFNYRTALTIGTRAVQQTLGLTGAGVGVAVIDSGIATWHDDLTNNSSTVYPYGNQRVTKFVDFVNGQSTPYDDDGHGTHVAGIIAGNGYDSNGQKAGAAPDASLIVLKVLDGDGNGTVSNIIAALDWVLANHTAYNIRVVNMSVGSAIHESAWTDPLTLAAKRVVDAGVVVVAAAGNFGKNSLGLPQYGGISAPGNAPWVLTVGGSSTQGTASRADDVVGSFSSRGPTYIDWTAKPDLVAPGMGTVSLASAGSNFYLTKPTALLAGSIVTANLPYLSLTGTSMAAPVVAGTVALMLQANPSLTPNAVKAILQYTAEQYPDYNALTQGAGFLNAVGAVRLQFEPPLARERRELDFKPMQQFIDAEIGKLRPHRAGVETRNIEKRGEDFFDRFERSVDIANQRGVVTGAVPLDQACHVKPRGIERLQNIVTGRGDEPGFRHIGFIGFRLGAFERGVEPSEFAGTFVHAPFQRGVGALQRLRRFHARRYIGERGHQSAAGHMIGAHFDHETLFGDALEERLGTGTVFRDALGDGPIAARAGIAVLRDVPQDIVQRDANARQFIG